MKLSVIPLLVAGAGLALEQVSASPIRVVVVTSHQEMSVPGTMRFEHGAASADVAQIMRPSMMSTTAEYHHGLKTQSGQMKSWRHQLGCSKLRNKAIEISNRFRKIFGLPAVERLPEMSHHGMHAHAEKQGQDGDNLVHIMPFVGTPVNVPVPVAADSNDPESVQPASVQVNTTLVPTHRMSMKCRRASFMRRIHRALMTLGPWEGRAVAFVLGCGIGVIFRMIWVMAIVTFRLFKGRKEEAEYELVYEQDAEDILVPPPQYTDEKVDAIGDIKVAPPAEA